MARIFVSHASKDRLQSGVVDPIVERLRTHYLDTWFSPRDIPAIALWEDEIRKGLAECDWFVVVLTQNALESEWVRREVALAMADPRYFDPEAGNVRIVLILARRCEWRTIHPKIHRCQFVDLVASPAEQWRRLLWRFGVAMQERPQYTVGDVVIPVHVFVGGEGHTRFGPGDVVCDGPRGEYQPPDDVQALADDPDGPLARKAAEAREKGQVFIDNRQVRLKGACWGAPNSRGGIDDKPLRLELEWTRYYWTYLTNMNVDVRLPDGLTIGQKYQSAIDDLAGSRLSNPFAVNLSVVTSDGWIYVGLRSKHVAWNTPDFRPTYQPAVSGAGQAEDLDANGTFDPFFSGTREATEEVTGRHFARPEDVVFFGLARTLKTRFPFLFGELRVPLTRKRLESSLPLKKWEGDRIPIRFSVEETTDWVRDRFLDQKNRRLGAAVGTTLFSLLQSLQYQYPDRWDEVVERLSDIEE